MASSNDQHFLIDVLINKMPSIFYDLLWVAVLIQRHQL